MKFHCSQDEDVRCHRLLSVLEFVHRAHRGFDVFNHVDVLGDDKGTLIVYWKIEPPAARMAVFAEAWGSAGNEPEENVLHRRAIDGTTISAGRPGLET